MSGTATRKQGLPLAELGLAAALIAAPFVLPFIAADVPMLSRILIWGFFGLGFSILFGFTGLLSLGQAVFFGAGGFVTGWLMVEHRLNVIPALLAGTLAAVLLGVVIGYFTERRRGIYFAMITLAFGEMFAHMDLTTFAAFTGGENGLPGVPAPSLFGWRADTSLRMYAFLAVVFFVGYAIARRIVASPVGRILLAIRDNENRALATGNAVHLYKLCAFTIAAAYAGLAGGLLGMFQNYMPPDAFTFETSGQLLIQTVIGGASALLGPLVGGAVWIYLRETLQHSLGFDTSWRLILGVIFVLLVSFLRLGIVGEIIRWARRPPPPADVDHESQPAASVAPLAKAEVALGPAVLETRGLTKRFGGIVANEDVDFSVREFEVRGLIGPNGAGKSTFFRMLAGEMTPSSGTVLFRGQDVSGDGVCAMCQQGVAKSYQINQLFDRLTVRQNLLIPTLAAQARAVPARPAAQPALRVGAGGGRGRDAATGRPHAPGRYASEPACLWRKAAAGDRVVPGQQPENPAARRAARRHEPGRAGEHGAAAAAFARGPHHGGRRARHGRDVRHRRQDHRAGRGQDPDRGHARPSALRPGGADRLSRRRRPPCPGGGRGMSLLEVDGLNSYYADSHVPGNQPAFATRVVAGAPIRVAPWVPGYT